MKNAVLISLRGHYTYDWAPFWGCQQMTEMMPTKTPKLIFHPRFYYFFWGEEGGGDVSSGL